MNLVSKKAGRTPANFGKKKPQVLPDVLSNANLSLRNASNSMGTGFSAGPLNNEEKAIDGLHDVDCDCNGRGYFVGNQAIYGRSGSNTKLSAPAGRVLLTYCGVCDAPSDEEILAAYGTSRDLDYDIDKWGVMVVFPFESFTVMV